MPVADTKWQALVAHLKAALPTTRRLFVVRRRLRMPGETNANEDDTRIYLSIRKTDGPIAQTRSLLHEYAHALELDRYGYHHDVWGKFQAAVYRVWEETCTNKVRVLAATLRERFPIKYRLVIRLVDITTYHGSCLLEPEQERTITITISKNDPPSVRCDSLIHEYAHALVFNRWGWHGPYWHRFYGRVVETWDEWASDEESDYYNETFKHAVAAGL